MSYKLIKMYLSKYNECRPGKIIKPKGLVIHWTANTGKGADADNNRNYFENCGEYVSAHYVVDDYQVVQCLPENEMAYHVGARSYKANAKKGLSNYPNDCTIGIEICVNKDGDFKKTLKNTIELSRDICRRYGWGKNNLWRHFDITGKDCPKFFVTDNIAKQYGFESASKGWDQFKNAIFEEDDDLKQVYIDVEGKLLKTKGAINDEGMLLIPIRELNERLNLGLVMNVINNKGYVRRKKEGE